MFYFDWRTWRKMLRLAWREQNPRTAASCSSTLLVVVPCVASFHALCFFLDPHAVSRAATHRGEGPRLHPRPRAQRHDAAASPDEQGRRSLQRLPALGAVLAVAAREEGHPLLRSARRALARGCDRAAHPRLGGAQVRQDAPPPPDGPHGARRGRRRADAFLRIGRVDRALPLPRRARFLSRRRAARARAPPPDALLRGVRPAAAVPERRAIGSISRRIRSSRGASKR